MSKKLIYLMSFVLVLAVTGTASADQLTITIDNPGFEDPVLAEDDYTWGDVPGWTLVGGEVTNTEGSGVWNVTLGDFDPVMAPEGENVLFTEYLPEGIAKGVAQVLTETFAVNTDYTLTVEIGNSNYYDNGGYSVQLLAGGTVIAEDNDTLWPDSKKWATSTVAYTYDPADSALVGQPLEIRLLNLELDKDSPPAGEVVGVEFDNVTLSYVAGAEPGVTIPVDPNSDLAAANALANPGDTILFAEGTYDITSQIEIMDGVTYQGAGAGLTIIDGNDTTRAFVAWGDRGAADGQVDVNGVSVPNLTGPKGWVLEGMTIQNCVADSNDRFSYTASAFDMNDVFAENDADASGGLSPDEANADSGGIRLPGPDGTEGTEDDDLHRFAHIDTDGNGELSQAELLAQIAVAEDEFGDQDGDGGAISIDNEAVGTIQNCDFLNNHTPAEGAGGDGGALIINGRSTITINDCLFDGNYAVSPNSVEVDGFDGDGGHIRAAGGSVAGGFIEVGITLICNRCFFLNGNAEDDGGVMQVGGEGIVVRLDSCWFEGNNSWDNGTVLAIQNEDTHEATVTNCIFVNNIAHSEADVGTSSDRMIETRRNSKFINCTFVGNHIEDGDMIYNNANKADGDNDGEDDEMADTMEIVNCIFANNTFGPDADNDSILSARNTSFTFAATNCLFFNNLKADGSAMRIQDKGTEAGSVLTDPLLDANYVPGAGSPAIDAGTAEGAPDHDFDGAPRPQGAAHDVGAYEFVE